MPLHVYTHAHIFRDSIKSGKMSIVLKIRSVSEPNANTSETLLYFTCLNGPHLAVTLLFINSDAITSENSALCCNS